MLRERTLFVSRFIDEEAANEIISMMLYLRKESMKEPIDIYFNVPGALLRPGLAVYDLISQTRDQGCEIRTVNLGLCAGIGAMLVGAGTKGCRRAMPNARFLLQHTGLETVYQGQASDIALEVKSVVKANERLDLELHKMTGQSIPQMRKDMERDFYLFADEAVQYGLIDQVLLPTFNKRSATGGEAGLGNFGGEAQRYQGQAGDGFGSQTQVQQQKDDDDYEGPEVSKG
jgi:ATP-dependent Clp protease protease subunit